MAKKEEKAELATVAPSGLPAHLAHLADQYSKNAGLENIDQMDLKRPFFRILQPTSKELIPNGEKYMPDAKMGLWIEGAISRELLPELKIVPIHVIKGYTEFVPQNQGGGFVGFHLDDSEMVKSSPEVDYATLKAPNGNELKRTFQLFVLVDPVGKGRPELGIVSFSGGALAEVRKFLSYAVGQSHPVFFKQYNLTTIAKFNKKHNSTTFRPDFNVDKSEYVDETIIKAAAKFQEELNRGQLAQDILNASGDDDTASGEEAVEANIV